MKRLHLPLVLSALFFVPTLVGQRSFADEPRLEMSEVFPAGMNDVALYRIPGIVVTPKGTLIAYCEARLNGSSDWGEIEIHVRRSMDQGRTWTEPVAIAHRGERLEGNPNKATPQGALEQTVNNPVAIVDHNTGAIEFLYCINYAKCFAMRSTDDGESWSEPVEITSTFEPFREFYDWTCIATGPGHGVQLASGRLLVPVWLAYGEPGAHKPSFTATIYSDDHGATWKAGEVIAENTDEFSDPNEAMIAVRNDDSVMVVARSTSNPLRKIVAVSPNGIGDWSEPKFHDELWEPICMASIVSHPAEPQMLLFSNPHSLARDETGALIPGKNGKRENLSIKLSLNNGDSWPFSKTLEAGPSAYSDLAVLPDGSIVCLYEGNRTIAVARFNLEWVKEAQVVKE